MLDRLKNALDESGHPPLGVADPVAFEARVAAADLTAPNDETLFQLYRERDPSKDDISPANRTIREAFERAGLDGYFPTSVEGGASNPRSRISAQNIGLIAAVVAVAVFGIWKSWFAG